MKNIVKIRIIKMNLENSCLFLQTI